MRTVVESQMISLRIRLLPLLFPWRQYDCLSGSSTDLHRPTKELLPAQPRRIFLTGAGSLNSAVARICGEVLGGVGGVYRLKFDKNRHALGAAYKVAWACEGKEGEDIALFIDKRLKRHAYSVKVDEGYRAGVWEKYWEMVEMYKIVEWLVVAWYADRSLTVADPIVEDPIAE